MKKEDEKSKKESDFEMLLKIKASYDLATIAAEARDKKEKALEAQFQDTLDKIEMIDYLNYLEKDLFQAYLYQREKGGRNLMLTIVFVIGLEIGAFTILPIVWQTIFAAIVVLVTSFVFLAKNFLGVHDRYMKIWKNGIYENEQEALKQLIKDAYDKNSGVAYAVYSKYTTQRRMKEIEKQMNRIA